MRIRTRLTLTALAPTVLALAIIVALTFSYRTMSEAQQNTRKSQHITTSLNAMNSTIRQYLLHKEDRPKNQFHAEHADIVAFMAAVADASVQERDILDRITREIETTSDLFVRLVDNHERRASSPNSALIAEAEERLTGQIIIRLNDAVSETVRLERYLDDRITSTQSTANILIFLLIVVTVFPFTFFLNRTMKSVTTSLDRLRKGTERVGSGDLGHRIRMPGGDELAELAGSFDGMAEKLQAVTVSRDILQREVEQRKKAEDELRVSENRYRSFIEVTGELGWTTNANGEVEEDVPSFRAFTGQSFEEVKGLGWTAAVHPDDVEATVEIWKKAVSERSNYQTEYRLRRHDGVYRYFLARGVPLLADDGNIHGWVGTCIDITERRETEEDLRATRDYLDNLVNHANAPIIVWDSDFVVTRVNLAYERLTGYSGEHVVGKKLDVIFPPESRDSSMEYVRQAASGERWDSAEIPIALSGGTERILLWNSAVLYASDGRTVVATIAQGQDITERKQVEAVKDEFIGMVSHELKTPLTVIIGALSVAMGQDTSTDEAKLLILDAVTSADSLAGIVDNLIELSRYQSDRLSLQSAPADVSEIASEVVKRLQAKSPLHHLAVDVSADVPPANVDRVRIERVIYNLVENAIKYSPGGGEVRVRGRRDDGHIVVGVSDEGIGISEEDQARLFRSFERIDAYQKYSIPGLGLGLRVCRILIEAHGGRIWVESAKGVGSTFLFTVPIAEGTQKAAESTG